ncbi:DUF5681 domain-containing protein [bacterium]|nr:DUF5681 domain-containing protein [bacterium]
MPAKTEKKQGRKTQNRFQAGESGNPNGRPSGSRNKASLAVEELLEGELEGLTRKAIELALEGNIQALRLCLDRLCPPKKDRKVSFAIPEVQTTSDVVKALSAITKAVSLGELTTQEGQAVASIMEHYRKAIELEEVEKRLTELENHIKSN